MNRNDQEDGENSNKSRVAHFLEQQVTDDNGEEWCRPHRVDKDRDQVEAVDIVRQEIHDLSWGSVAQSILGQLSGLPVDGTAHGNPDPHAGDEALVHKLIHVEGTEEADAHNSPSSHPRIVLGESGVVLAEELQELSQEQWLDDAHDLIEDGDHAQFRVLPPEGEDNGPDQTGSLIGTVLQLSLPFPVDRIDGN